MMYYIKITVKFIVVFILLFAVLFTGLLLINILPVSHNVMTLDEISSTGKAVLVPVFYIAFFNSLIIALFLYSFLIVDYVHLHNPLIRIVPWFISVVSGGCLIYFLQPDMDILAMQHINDARSYLEHGAFFMYKNEIPVSIATDTFQELYTAAGKTEQKLLKSVYIKNSYRENYALYTDASLADLEKLRLFFLKHAVINDIKLYIGKVNRDSVEQIYLSENDQLLIYTKAPVRFINGKLYLKLPDRAEELVFYKRIYVIENEENLSFIYKIIGSNSRMLEPFLTGHFLVDLMSWCAIVYLLLTLSGIIYNGNFPLISIVLNLILLLVIYVFAGDIYGSIQWFFRYIAPETVQKVRYYILALLMVLPALVFNSIRDLIHRSVKAGADADE